MKTQFLPVQPNQRHEILDLLRGFALLGILMVNMPLMNAPFATELSSYALWTDPVNTFVHGFIRFFFTGKFYTLFSMLFGIGFYFFLKKAEASGDSAIPTFRRRLGWLLAIGILHVVLLWYGDILVFYALFGFLLILFRKKSNKSIVIWASVILLIPITLAILFTLMFQLALSMPESAPSVQASLDASDASMRQFIQDALVIYPTGSFREIVMIRLKEYANILGGILFFFPNVLAMFLVGVLLARKRVFENLDEHAGFFRKLLLFSLPVALLGNLLYIYAAANGSMMVFNRFMIFMMIGQNIGGPALTLVYISIIVFIFRKGYLKKITSAIAGTGRMALTNYLMQSVIATTLFFSYGFGLYGKINLWQGILLTLAIYVTEIIWSNYWLRYYQYGPMEWLWRTLTYRKKQKMKIRQEVAVSL
jgi:uncharacterized protein